jgi:DNA polymerase-3 subunit delta
MTYEDIMSELKAGKYKPVYFLTGEEPFFIDRITTHITDNALKEEEKAFNQTILYGRDSDIRTILSSAKRFPMMASRQVIVVREAQQLKSLDGLDTYLAAPVPTTVLVFAYKYKKIDKRTKAAKMITEKTVFLESNKLREDKVSAWISGYLKEIGCQADVKSAALLVDFLGNDLGRIANEIDKLLLTMPAGSRQITPELIEKNIGISKDYNTFELTKALSAGNMAKTARIIRYFADNPKNNPFVLIISTLFYYFGKVLLYHSLQDKSRDNAGRELGVPPFAVDDYVQAARIFPMARTVRIISWLREYDLKAKGSSMASEADLMKELIFKITH